MDKFIKEELERMKYLFAHERGRVISEQVTPAGTITAPGLTGTINSPRPQLQSQPEIEIGETAKDQAEADTFRKWINTAPNVGYKCPDGRNLIAAPGRNFTGPCFKKAWSEYGKSFKSNTQTPAASTTADTTTTGTQDYYVSKPNPSLEGAFNDVLKQIGGTGFTTFLYSKRDPDYEAISSNLTVDQLVQKYGQTFSQYPNAATTIGAPVNGVFTEAYISKIKEFESKQSGANQPAVTSDTKSNTATEIKTPEQAQAAIATAEQKAKELKAQTKVDKEICRTVGKAINPINPLKKGVTSPDLCNKLWQCMDQGFIVRGDQKFIEACPKPAEAPKQG